LRRDYPDTPEKGVSGAAGSARWARRIWLVYALASIAAALALLAVYVNAYDDYDVGDRLRGLGLFTRRAMLILSAPIGLPLGALANPALAGVFGCGDENEPCAVFVDWNMRFFALVAQIVILRFVATRKA
jgi:hypothetical protein